MCFSKLYLANSLNINCFLYLGAILAVSIFTACYKDGPSPELHVYKNEIILGNLDEGSLEIYSNGPWTIIAPDSWLFFSNYSGSGSATIHVFAKSRNNSTKARTASFMIECDGNAETIYVTQNPHEYPEEIRLLASYEDDEKTWQWDTSVSSYGYVWGIMGYQPGDGTQVGNEGYGEWWGCKEEDDFKSINITGSPTYQGEGNNKARMIFGKDGSIRTVDAYGSVIRNGNYRVESYNENGLWKVGNLITDALLWPYGLDANYNYSTTSGIYEIVFLTKDKMSLVYPSGGDSGIGSWAGATFWHFKAQ